MDDDYSRCVGCGETFLTKNAIASQLIGSSTYNIICHKQHCGNSKECLVCDVYINKQNLIHKEAIKCIFNTLVAGLKALNDSQLETLKEATFHIAPLVLAELDKRQNLITDYSFYIENNEMILRINK